MPQYAHNEIVPDKSSSLSKKKQVAEMFNNIAGRYDFLNHFLSLGIDVHWRRKAIKELKVLQPKQILDVATGTGDFALMAHKILKPQKIKGIDISESMLQLGIKKIKENNLSYAIELMQGDSETINFDSNAFDAVTVAFGVRNFENLEKGLSEILRVMKPEGKLVVLEFSRPKGFFRYIYNFYMHYICPLAGKLFARNKSAYAYLNKSVQTFPERENFVSILQQTGFQNTYFKTLTGGVCCIYCGSK